MSTLNGIHEYKQDHFVDHLAHPTNPTTVVAILLAALVVLPAVFGTSIGDLAIRAWHLYLAILTRARVTWLGRPGGMEGDSAASAAPELSQALDGMSRSGGGFMARVLGFGKESLLKRDIPLRGIGSFLKGVPRKVPPGLGNFDNSCYQNSVIQVPSPLFVIRTTRSMLIFSHRVSLPSEHFQNFLTIPCPALRHFKNTALVVNCRASWLS